MRKGELAYGGYVREVNPYFSFLGWPVPASHNPADFVVEVCCDIATPQKRCGLAVATHLLAQHWRAQANFERRKLEGRWVLPGQFEQARLRILLLALKALLLKALEQTAAE